MCLSVCTESFDTKTAGVSVRAPPRHPTSQDLPADLSCAPAASLCLAPRQASKHLARHAGRNQRHKLLTHSLSRFITQDPSRPSYNRLKKGSDFEACEEAYATLYMNRAVGRQAGSQYRGRGVAGGLMMGWVSVCGGGGGECRT